MSLDPKTYTQPVADYGNEPLSYSFEPNRPRHPEVWGERMLSFDLGIKAAGADYNPPAMISEGPQNLLNRNAGPLPVKSESK